ncbi:MAG: helix-hairpin-helix domain-containing protein [Prevotella sp.]|nr:helix-hairpin-helix domain-containing protein [Prevotella sp.]
MFLKEFFYFSKSDRKIILFVLFIGIIATAAIFGISSITTNREIEEKTDTVVQKKPISSSKNTVLEELEDETLPKAERFYFDPNTATANELFRLGLTEWQIKNIYKYRKKGGIYRKPSDFARLYGMTVEQFKQLEPFIRIKGDYRPASELFKNEEKEAKNTVAPRDTTRYPVKIAEGEQVTLNGADSTTLKRVPGIGSGWARQILAYEKRLGGFVSVEQLREINGFPEECIKFFNIHSPNVRKLNINKLTLNQLRQHPYINFYQAREICDYRKQKGKIQSLNELKLLKEFPAEKIAQLEPYIEY